MWIDSGWCDIGHDCEFTPTSFAASIPMLPVIVSMSAQTKRIRCIGFWGRWVGVFPHPTQLLDSPYSQEERDSIRNYIANTPDLAIESHAAVWGASQDRNFPCFAFDLKCDGEWMYPSSLASAVMEGVTLPQAFVSLIRERGYLAPSERLKLSDLTSDEGEFWIRWSVRNSALNRSFVWHLARLAFFYPLRLLFVSIPKPESRSSN